MLGEAVAKEYGLPPHVGTEFDITFVSGALKYPIIIPIGLCYTIREVGYFRLSFK